jgi:hypothetical protein
MLFLLDSLCCADGSCGAYEAAEMAAYTFSAHAGSPFSHTLLHGASKQSRQRAASS